MPAVGDQRALGMTGRARRVDDERGGVGIERGRLLLEPAEVRLARGGQQFLVRLQLGMPIGEHRGIVEHDDPPELRQAVGERQDLVDVFLVLRDEDGGAAVAHLVLDLGGRRGRIDAVDDGAERLRRQVADQPLLAGIPHDGDALAAHEAQFGEGPRRARDQRRIVVPAALAIEPEMLGAERDRIGLNARSLAQQQRRGLAAQCVAIDRCGHTAPVQASPYLFL